MPFLSAQLNCGRFRPPFLGGIDCLSCPSSRLRFFLAWAFAVWSPIALAVGSPPTRKAWVRLRYCCYCAPWLSGSGAHIWTVLYRSMAVAVGNRTFNFQQQQHACSFLFSTKSNSTALRPIPRSCREKALYG